MNSIDIALPWIFASFGGALAALGCLTALSARRSISTDREQLKGIENHLTPSEAWRDAYAHDHVDFSKWMRKAGISSNSHISDYVRSCWSAWLGGRSVTLSELHQLVSRRERSRRASRISGGIAALLLVVGILGTLFSIHPVLKAFQLKTNESGEFEEISESTELVNSLINNLGDAFIPSLVALFGTVLVVSCRGLYGYQLNRFVLELDSFAIDFLIPRFRPATLADQFREVKDTFTKLADGISEREAGFEAVVKQLEVFVERISPAVESLASASKTTQKSAEILSSKSQSISNGISRHLGKASPMYKAVAGFGDVFSRTELSIEKLSELVKEQGDGNHSDREDLKAVVKSLEEAVRQILDDHNNDRSSAADTVKILQLEAEKLPGRIDAKAKEAIDVGIKAINVQLQILKEDQRREGEEIVKEIRDQLLHKVTEISNSASLLPGHIEQLQEVIKSSQKISEQCISSIKETENLANEDVEHSRTLLNDVRRELGATAADLETKLTVALDRLIVRSTEDSYRVQSSKNDLTTITGLPLPQDDSVSISPPPIPRSPIAFSEVGDDKEVSSNGEITIQQIVEEEDSGKDRDKLVELDPMAERAAEEGRSSFGKFFRRGK